MHFQVGLAITLDRWPHADVGDAWPGLAVDVDVDQIHPGQRHATALELHVGRGRTQLARQFLTVQHPPRDPERTTEQTLGQGKIGGGQGVAHLRAADTNTVQLDSLCRLDGKTLHHTGLLQEIEIPYPIAPETEIVTDLQMLHAQAVDQNGVDEFAGAELAQTLVEGQAQDPVDTFVGQQLQLVPQAGQTGRRSLGGKELPRLRLENHHAAGYVQLKRTFTQPGQDSLVTTVNTVKVANSGDTAPMLGAQIVEASNQLHNALLAHKVVDYNHTRRPTTGNTVTQSDRADKTPGPPVFIEVKTSAQRLAIEVAQTEAHQQQHAEIGHHARHHQGAQTQETLKHMPLIPGRHEMHSGQQYRGHHQHSNHQLKAELPPARLRLVHLLFAQLIEQQTGVNAGTNTDSQCQAGMGQWTDQHQVEQLGNNKGENRDFHRCADVLLRIKARRQHFDHDNPEQTDRISDQRPLSHRCIKRAELAVLEQRNGQRLRQNPQCQGARQHQHEAQAQAPIEDSRILVAILAGVSLGQGRQQNRAQRHAQHAGRQLHQAVRSEE